MVIIWRLTCECKGRPGASIVSPARPWGISEKTPFWATPGRCKAPRGRDISAGMTGNRISRVKKRPSRVRRTGADHMEAEKVKALATQLANDTDADILLYNSDFQRPWDNYVIRKVRSLSDQRRSNVGLILVTHGGEPDAAYRIARYLQDCYDRFTVYVPGRCKSAGTLAVLGANEIAMSDYGELGPIDIQVARPDEIATMASGLTASTALEQLRDESFAMFEKTMLSVYHKSGGAVSTKTAAEIATRLTIGLFAPIFSQIQAMHVGEVGRLNDITTAYGKRLIRETSNLK